jgi:hypothetical protein
MSHDVSRAESGGADMPQLTKVAPCIVARWHLNQAASARENTSSEGSPFTTFEYSFSVIF